jgi:hypothetical protein
MRKNNFYRPITFAEILRNCKVTNEGCLEWQSAHNLKGYGVMRRNKKIGLVTRQVMHILYGFELDSALLVRHKCHNPPCVNPEHLLIGTHKDNTRDAVLARRHNYGEKVPQAKLTEATVVEIFRLRKQGLLFREIAAQLDVKVDTNTLSAVVRRQTWRHVEVPLEYL